MASFLWLRRCPKCVPPALGLDLKHGPQLLFGLPTEALMTEEEDWGKYLYNHIIEHNSQVLHY